MQNIETVIGDAASDVAASLGAHLAKIGASDRAVDIHYMSNDGHPREFVDCGTLGSVFGAEVGRMTVGAAQGGNDERACYECWPVMLDGDHVGDLLDTAAGYLFYDPIIVSNFGSVDFGGRTYTLTQQAYCDNHGTNGGVRYYAKAVDAAGNTYRLAWDTTATWDAAEAANQAALRAGETPDDLDESDACDWQNPIDAELIAEVA